MMIRTAILGAAVVMMGCSSEGQFEEPTSQAPTGATAQALKKQKTLVKKFAGAWNLIPGGAYTQNPDGTRVYQLSPEAQGRIIITEDSLWAATLQNPHRIPCALPNQAQCTVTEVYPSLWRGIIAYQARAEIKPTDGNDWRKGKIFLHVDLSLVPNQVGTTLVRDYEVTSVPEGDLVTVSLQSTLIPGSVAVNAYLRSASNGDGDD